MKRLTPISSLSPDDKEKFDAALSNHKSNELYKSKKVYEELLKKFPEQPDILNLYATLLLQIKDYNKSKEVFLLLENLVKDNHLILNNIGVLYKNTYQYDLALEYFNKTLNIKPDYTGAILNKINTLILKNSINESLLLLNKFLHKSPDNLALLNLKSVCLVKSNDFENAEKCLLKILSINSNFIDAKVNLAILEFKKKNLDKSEALFSEIIKNNPKNIEALNHISLIYLEKKNYLLAKDSIQSVMSLDPNNAQATNNLGTLYMLEKKFEESLSCFDQVIELNPNYSEAIVNKFKVLSELKNYDEVNNFLKEKDLKNQNYDYFFGEVFKFKCSICDWETYLDDTDHILNCLDKNLYSCTPHSMLSFCDDTDYMEKSSTLLSSKRDNKNSLFKIKANPFEKKKITIAYFSSDFFNHATEILIGDIFEFHDRNKFEIIGISFSNEKKQINSDIEKKFDRFLDISDMLDIEASKLISNLDIDIAIDLNGHTKSARTHYFMNRVAPVQINFLGFAGTMSHENYDYIIADKVLIDDENIKNFSEKIIYLPDTYQPNKKNTYVQNFLELRKKYNLPNDKVIYCSFNDNYKITPEVFNIWIEILKEVENGLLWILISNDLAKKNILKVAKKHGVGEDKFIFADKVSYQEHLERLSCADIFLDTFPCNAHTTASDCLKSGLPIITLKGKSFQSRVAASLLTAVKMNELITYNKKDYKSLILKYSKNREELESIKKKLIKSTLKSNIFEPKVFASNLDKAFLRIKENFKNKIFKNLEIN